MLFKDRRRLGFWGENIAKNYLENKGIKIIEQNIRLGHKEVDLIGQKNNCLIFFEVKSKQEKNITGDELIRKKQYNNLRIAMRRYCSLKNWPLEATRLDLILITVLKEQKTKIVHYKNID
jgi:putative endonuclease